MTQGLDGKFWGPWIKHNYVSEIKSLRDTMIDRILLSLPDAEVEADAHTKAMWDWAMAQPSDGSDDPGMWAEWATDQGIERYERVKNMQQAVQNMGTVMLWHLLEQQMLSFHLRQVLSIHEEHEIRSDQNIHKRLHNLRTFKERLNQKGCDVTTLPAWKSVDELRLVANTVKHASGDSANDLYKIRPDLFTRPGLEGFHLRLKAQQPTVERPAGGEDLYVTRADLQAYFTASIEFWTQFCQVIEL